MALQVGDFASFRYPPVLFLAEGKVDCLQGFVELVDRGSSDDRHRCETGDVLDPLDRHLGGRGSTFLGYLFDNGQG